MPSVKEILMKYLKDKKNEAKVVGGKYIVRMKRPGQNTVQVIFHTKADADAYEKEKKKLGFQIEDSQKGFIVKFAKSKGGKISQAWYRSKADAEKALAKLKKSGLNGIISPGTLDDTMDEDAPVNSVAGGGVSMPPDAVQDKKKKKEIMTRLGTTVKENKETNSVLLNQVLDQMDKIDVIVDEKTYGKTEIEFVEDEDKKSILEKAGLKEFGAFNIGSGSYGAMHPIAALGDTPPKGRHRTMRSVGLVSQTDPTLKKEISIRLKAKVLDRKIKRFDKKFKQNLKDRKP